MECENCGVDLTGKSRVEVAGKTYCWSTGRLDELDAAHTFHKRIPIDGSSTYNNFRSPRTRG